MENLLQGRLKNNFSDEKIAVLLSDIGPKRQCHKTLSDYTKTIDFTDNIQDGFSFNTELSNAKVRLIVQKLARAIDLNSVQTVKNIKAEFGKEKEFSKAQKIINNKCKLVWNVYDNPTNVPYEAMKALGVTNQPDLDSLLGNSVKFFENDNDKTTVEIISSILSNKNLDYTIENIHKYLSDKHLKEKCKYNKNTIKYLILTHNYTEKNLIDLGVEKTQIKEIIKSLSIEEKFKHLALCLSLCFN